MRDVRLYLQDILEAMDSIESFIGGMTFEQFAADDKTSSAVLRKLEVIGEATKAIPDDVRAKHTAVPWKEMAGMRDRLIHSYFGVDMALVWTAVKERIPAVRPEVQKALQSMS